MLSKAIFFSLLLCLLTKVYGKTIAFFSQQKQQCHVCIIGSGFIVTIHHRSAYNNPHILSKLCRIFIIKCISQKAFICVDICKSCFIWPWPSIFVLDITCILHLFDWIYIKWLQLCLFPNYQAYLFCTCLSDNCHLSLTSFIHSGSPCVHFK